METAVTRFVDEWSNLKDADVWVYLRDSLPYIAKSNIDLNEFNQTQQLVSSLYKNCELKLIAPPIGQNNRVAIQWELICSNLTADLNLPNKIVISGADFVRTFKGKLHEADVYFNYNDIASLKKVFCAQRESTQYKKSGLTKELSQAIKEKIKQAMEQQKLYLNNELNLTTLSEYLNVPTSHLSQAINQSFKKNFYHLVAEYRLKEAKRLLANAKNDSILEVAFASGFNSKSVFHSAFKKQFGKTPSQFRKELLNDSL